MTNQQTFVLFDVVFRAATASPFYSDVIDIPAGWPTSVDGDAGGGGFYRWTFYPFMWPKDIDAAGEYDEFTLGWQYSIDGGTTWIDPGVGITGGADSGSGGNLLWGGPSGYTVNLGDPEYRNILMPSIKMGTFINPHSSSGDAFKVRVVLNVSADMRVGVMGYLYGSDNRPSDAQVDSVNADQGWMGLT